MFMYAYLLLAEIEKLKFPSKFFFADLSCLLHTFLGSCLQNMKNVFHQWIFTKSHVPSGKKSFGSGSGGYVVMTCSPFG